MPAATIGNLKETFDFDPKTGRFSWKAEPGFVQANGYRYIKVNGKLQLAHRLAWLYHYGEEPIGLVDHINGDRCDNKIENLRIATYSQNSANAKLHSRNTSGLKGASKVVKRGIWTGRWQASITFNRKQINLGSFKTKELAHAAYIAAAERLQGKFAHDGMERPMAPIPNTDWQTASTLGFGA